MNRIYCIPGLGVDHRLFSELKIENAELLPIHWEIPEKNESLKSYAFRLSKQIDASQPFMLLGVSFGGMLCTEISELLKPTHTIIVSSAKCRSDLPFYIRGMKYLPLYKLMSDHYLKKMTQKSLDFLGVTFPYEKLFIEMIESLPNNYIKRAIHCIACWNRKIAPKNIIHIHGNKDKVLPYGGVENAILLEGGTHSMILHQAKEISGLINSRISGS